MIQKRIEINSNRAKYIIQKHKVTDEERIKIIFFEIDNKILDSYNFAKFLQILAIMRKKNLFCIL